MYIVLTPSEVSTITYAGLIQRISRNGPIMQDLGNISVLVCLSLSHLPRHNEKHCSSCYLGKSYLTQVQLNHTTTTGSAKRERKRSVKYGGTTQRPCR